MAIPKVAKADNFSGSAAARASLETRQSTTYTDSEQNAVCDAFILFVKVHQSLLNTVIGKHGVLSLSGASYQVALTLQGVELIADKIAFTLIGEVPAFADKARAQKKALGKTLKKSIATYKGGLP